MPDPMTPPDGIACTSDSQCAEGYECKNGRCVKKISTIPIDPPPVGRPTQQDDKED